MCNVFNITDDNSTSLNKRVNLQTSTSRSGKIHRQVTCNSDGETSTKRTHTTSLSNILTAVENYQQTNHLESSQIYQDRAIVFVDIVIWI